MHEIDTDICETDITMLSKDSEDHKTELSIKDNQITALALGNILLAVILFAVVINFV